MLREITDNVIVQLQNNSVIASDCEAKPKQERSNLKTCLEIARLAAKPLASSPT